MAEKAAGLEVICADSSGFHVHPMEEPTVCVKLPQKAELVSDWWDMCKALTVGPTAM